jgi:hypothetical protein
MIIRPTHRHDRADRAASSTAESSSSRAPCLVASRQIDLHQQIDSSSCRGGGLVEAGDQPVRVDRLDDVEACRLLRFVRLQVSDQVPADRQIRRLVHLEQRFLDLVFAKVDLAGLGGGAHVLGGKCLGNGDEADGGGIAPGPAGRPRDPRANVRQPGPERSSVDHYFLIEPRIPFAVAAFGPAGASFR